MKSPMRNLLPLTVKAIAEKSGFPTIAAMSGVNKSFTSAATTAPKAPPITTATARSTTLPRIRNVLNPFSIVSSVNRLRFSERNVRSSTDHDLRFEGGAYGQRHPALSDCRKQAFGVRDRFQ